MGDQRDGTERPLEGDATKTGEAASKLSEATSLAVGAARQALGWAFTSAYVPGIVVACSLTSPPRRAVMGPAMTRRWGRIMAGIARVQITYTPAAAAALSVREPRVLVFNHGSTLDVLTGAALLPEGGVLVVKEEMRRIPLLGMGCHATGAIFLHRGDRERAIASLAAAAKRIRAERLQVLIAPEGTRSKDGTVGRFKLGAFHLAALAEVPILPIVLHDHVRLWPHGRIAPHPGAVTIDVLPQVEVKSREHDALHDMAAELRARYVASLAAGAASKLG